MPDVSFKLEMGAAKTARGEPKVATSEVNPTLPTPGTHFKASQYFNSSSVIYIATLVIGKNWWQNISFVKGVSSYFTKRHCVLFVFALGDARVFLDRERLC